MASHQLSANAAQADAKPADAIAATPADDAASSADAIAFGTEQWAPGQPFLSLLGPLQVLSMGASYILHLTYYILHPTLSLQELTVPFGLTLQVQQGWTTGGAALVE